MGRYQPHRGNPKNKLFYVIDNLIGGVNTEDNDDVANDNEFEQLINFTMDKKGTLQKRLGFGEMNALTQIFGLFNDVPNVKPKTAADPDVSDTNDNIVYGKLLLNENNCFRNLSAYSGDYAYRQYQSKYGFQNNSFKLLMITTNSQTSISTSWLFSCTLPDYTSGEDTIITSLTKTNLDVLFNWNENLFSIDSVEYFNKIFITNNNKAVVIFDRDTETYSYCGTGIAGVTNASYKPKPLEVRKIGFNLLGDSPLTWFDTQNITADTIQGMYITNSDGHPVLTIPNSNTMRIHIIYTGADNGFTFEFKEGGNDIEHTATLNAGLSVGGVKVYDIVFKQTPTSEIEIKVTKTSASIDPYYDYYSINTTGEETREIASLNVGELNIIEMYNRAVYYGGNTIWFSEINNFSYIPNYNYVELPIEPIDSIQKIVFFKNAYIIFTKYAIYKMIGQYGTTQFEVQPVNEGIGCHAPNTVVPIENYLYFASPDGLYALVSNAYFENLENVKPLDRKVKSLTSDLTLVQNEKSDPNVRFNGISENAYGVRYKDKYILFLNTYFDEGLYENKNNFDALSYYYDSDLRCFGQIKFNVKPPFMFKVDSALETFATVKEKEDYTVRETLFSYDFENSTSANYLVDKSGNGYDLTKYGNAQLKAGLGIKMNNTVENLLNMGSIDGNLDDGFVAELDMKLLGTSGVYELLKMQQDTPTETTQSTTFSKYTPYDNGIRFRMYFTTTPDFVNRRTKLSYTTYVERSSTSVIAATSGSYSLKKGSTTLASGSYSGLSWGSSTSKQIDSGNFYITHDTDYTYSENWTLSGYTQYGIRSTGYTYSNNISFDVTQLTDWSVGYGIRFKGSSVGYGAGAKVYLQTWFACKYALNVGSRAMYSYIDSTSDYQSIPAITQSTISGFNYYGGEQFSKIYSYTGSKTVSFDAKYNVQATLSGIYREWIDVSSFSRAITVVEAYDYTTYYDSAPITTTSVTLPTLTQVSYRTIELRYSKNTNRILLNLDSEQGSYEYYFDNVTLSNEEEHTIKMEIIKPSTFTFNCYVDDVLVMTVTGIDTKYIKDTLRTNNIIGSCSSSSSGMELYKFELSSATSEIIYDFREGTGTTVYSQGSSSIQANFGSNDVSWILADGLVLWDEDAYLKIPEIDDSIGFSNGFEITLETRAFDDTIAQLILEMAASNEVAPITVSYIPNKLRMISKSIDLKTYKIDTTNSYDTKEKISWKIDVTDNGSGYTLSIYKDTILENSLTFNYGGITNINRLFNYIGKSQNENVSGFVGEILNMEVVIKASASPVTIYKPALFEYETTYDEFNEPMDIVLETRGINMKYPLHIKKLKKLFIKGLGGYNYQEFLFELFADGHLTNDPTKYFIEIDENTGEIVYNEIVDKYFSFNEAEALLGNMRLGVTKLGASSYETKKINLPAKGKNFSFKITGSTSDNIKIESFGILFKLGKVKE